MQCLLTRFPRWRFLYINIKFFVLLHRQKTQRPKSNIFLPLDFHRLSIYAVIFAIY